jgi:hypothetical protein
LNARPLVPVGEAMRSHCSSARWSPLLLVLALTACAEAEQTLTLPDASVAPLDGGTRDADPAPVKDASADAAAPDAEALDGGAAPSDAEVAPDAAPADAGRRSERVVLLGGLDIAARSSAWSFDGSRWAELRAVGGDPPASRDYPVLVSLGATLFLHGGSLSVDNPACPQPRLADDSRLFDGAAWTNLPSARACTQVSSGARLGALVVMAGGSARTWVFDGVRLQPRQQPSPRGFRSGMATLGGRALLFGGATASEVLGETWAYDGETWSQLDVPGPGPRLEHAMATLGDRVVVFGGRDRSGPLGDTWVFDGVEWRELDIPGPSPRSGVAMARLGDRLILYGGYDGVGCNEDTWAFDGARWEQLADAGSAWRRCNSVMATLETE